MTAPAARVRETSPSACSQQPHSGHFLAGANADC
jgi:hypothetical protein